MKGNRRRNVWLALAAVAAACLVLAGCPHNGLLDSSGSSGGLGGGGSRGGNGEVRLIVTNFASDKGTSRSASWLAPSRTITPDHIDLKVDRDKYVFVAEGSNNGGDKYGPEYITLEADGSTSLGITGSGIWSITVSAYEATKLNGQGGIVGTTATAIMQQTTNPQDVIDNGTTALVLKGGAVLDLGMSSTGVVTVTLTNDGVGTNGNVLVNVYFDAGDKTKLNDNGGNDYSVEVGLYDYVTGELVGGNKRDEIKPPKVSN